MVQSKLERAMRRQRRSSSFVSTNLEHWNKSDTVEFINLVSDSPQQSSITIVTSSSPKDFMVHKSPGQDSKDKMVQKLHVHQDAPVQASQQPIRSNQPAREPTSITISDSPPTAAITFDSQPHAGRSPTRKPIQPAGPNTKGIYKNWRGCTKHPNWTCPSGRGKELPKTGRTAGQPDIIVQYGTVRDHAMDDPGTEPHIIPRHRGHWTAEQHFRQLVVENSVAREVW